MKIEKGRVAFGNRPIDFFIKRSKRRKTISIFVDPFDGVFLRAPLWPSAQELSKLVHSKAVWILNKQRQIEEIKEFLPKREFVGGETFLYLGKQLRLAIINLTKKSRPGIKAKQGRFIISLNTHYTELGKRRIVRKLLVNWYKRHAQIILKKRASLYVKKLKIAPPALHLANQSKRWGSCSSKGRVRLNWHIIMAPMSLVDYVVAHELCHLKHINHSKDFWQFLGSILPDYEERREHLRKEGPKYYFS